MTNDLGRSEIDHHFKIRNGVWDPDAACHASGLDQRRLQCRWTYGRIRCLAPVELVHDLRAEASAKVKRSESQERVEACSDIWNASVVWSKRSGVDSLP